MKRFSKIFKKRRNEIRLAIIFLSLIIIPNGRASNLDITDAQESLLRTQNLYARKLVDYYTQLALLESLTGQSIQ